MTKNKISWSLESEFPAKTYKIEIDDQHSIIRHAYRYVDVTDSRRLVILPGSTEGAKDSSSENAIKSITNLLKHYNVNTKGVTLYTATYYHPYPSGRTRQTVDELTAEPKIFSSPDADVISRSLLPLIAKNVGYDANRVYGKKLPISEVIENFSRTTFVGKSKGTLITRELENRLARYMLEDFGYSEDEVETCLKEMFSVGIANIFITSDALRRSNGMYYTSVSDKKAAKYFPEFSNTVNLSGGVKLRIEGFSRGKSALCICDIPESLSLVNGDEQYIFTDNNVHKFLSYTGIRSNPEENTTPLAIANSISFGLGRKIGHFQDKTAYRTILNFIEKGKGERDQLASYVQSNNFPNGPKVLLWAESLVGGGHLNYIGTIGCELAKKGYNVMFATGSKQYKAPNLLIPDVKFIDLPGIYGNFKSGITYSNNDIPIQDDTKWQGVYKTKLLQVYTEFKPDIVVTEFWPIRRGPLDFAMLPLLEKINNEPDNPIMATLIRDYVHMSVTNTAVNGSDTEAAKIINDYYDTVLVHSIRDLIPLEKSFTAAKAIEDKTKYIGYIIPKYNGELKKQTRTRDLVIVTSGSGWVDYSFETTTKLMSTISKSNFKNDQTIVLIPHDIPADKYQILSNQAQMLPNITLEYNRNDFDLLLQRSKAIFTHGGNSIIEALDARVPSVFVTPRMSVGEAMLKDDGKLAIKDGVQKEQLFRAVAFNNAGYIKVFTPDQLKSEYLLNSINSYVAKVEWTGRLKLQDSFNGASNGAKIIEDLYKNKDLNVSINRNNGLPSL